jgi:hypothetical protein
VLRGVGPFLINPRTRGRAITLTFDQFRYGWANALDEQEAMEPLRQVPRRRSGRLARADGQREPQPWTEAKVDTKNPDRGPAADHRRRRRTTRCRGRSRTPPTSCSRATPA